MRYAFYALAALVFLLAIDPTVVSAQSEDGKIRVFVGESATWEANGFNIASASGSANWQSAQSSARAFGMSHAGVVKLTVAVMKQLNDRCQNVVVVNRPDIADYFVRVDHNQTMWTRHEDMQYSTGLARWCSSPRRIAYRKT